MFENDSFIILPLGTDHSVALRINKDIHSAGFVQLYEKQNEFGETIMKANCYGKSISLSTLEKEMVCDKKHDELIINIELSNTI